jgi:SAM-dependent methyltransferase
MSDASLPSPAQRMWDDRYRTDNYVYGTEPNEFLRLNVEVIPEGDVLCLAEGEGRNATFLAKTGRHVTGVELSEVAVAKARKMAKLNNVEVDLFVDDLRYFDLGHERWDGVISIFAHMPPSIRAELHGKVVDSLRPGGVFILEAYTPAQVGRGTGGPERVEMTMSLDLLVAQEIDRIVIEGSAHHGVGAVVQVVARKRPF